MSRKRLSIFIIFDKDNIIDEYEIPIMDSLKDASDDMIIVSNSQFDEKQCKVLYSYTDKVLFRENKGLDAGAFKSAYDKYKDLICSYDEVLLVNDTFYGPFVLFKKICDEMGNRKVDFWGLTANYESEDGYGFMPDNIIHSHIQTFFIAFRNNVLNSKCFQDYWDNYDIDKMNSFIDVVTKHELSFTNYLEKNGFKWDTYVDLSHYKSDNYLNNYNIYGYSMYSLIKDFNCPFIKRKNFVFNKQDAMYINDGMDTRRAFEYIKNNKLYDAEVILKNLKRLYKPYELYQGLNLNYVIDEFTNCDDKNLIIVNVCDERLFEISKPYFDGIKKSKVSLFTEDKEISKKLDIKYEESVTNYIKHNRSDLIKKYDNICLLNVDNKYCSFQEIADSNVFRLLDNLIKSDRYISSISSLLKNDIIDILFAPESLHNKYLTNLNGSSKKKLLHKDFSDNGSKIIRSLDGVWFKSDVLSDIENYDLSFDKFVGLFDTFTNHIYGKVYSKEYVGNDIIAFENMINSLLSDADCVSYPNIMLQNNNQISFARRVYNKTKRIIKKVRRGSK